MSVCLEPITRFNIDGALGLCVTPEQEPHVGTVAEALAYAYVCPTYCPQLIMHDGTIVGFAATELLGTTTRLLRLLIDHRHQRRGFGAAAFRLLAAQARAKGATQLDLYVHYAAADSIAFYRAVGCTVVTDDGASHHHAVYELQ